MPFKTVTPRCISTSIFCVTAAGSDVMIQAVLSDQNADIDALVQQGNATVQALLDAD